MINKIFKILFYTIIFLIFVSCSSSHNNDPLSAFKELPIILKPSFIETDQPILLGGFIEMVTDSILAVTSLKEDTLLTLIHIPGKRIFKRMVPKGKGPGEMTMIIPIRQTNKDQLFIEDPNQRVIYKLDMETIITKKSHHIEPIVRLEGPFITKIDSFFVVAGPNIIDNRFQIFDIQGGMIASCLKYQKPDEYQNMPDHLYSLGFQGVYTVHPNNKKFVFATHWGGIIQYFDFMPESISLNTDLSFYHPSFTFDEVGRCIMDRNSINGFAGIDSDANFVYALYSGETKVDYLQDPTCSHLLVFDWNGNPVKRFELDIPLFSFCLNMSGDKIYGIAFNPETVIVQYNLK